MHRTTESLVDASRTGLKIDALRSVDDDSGGKVPMRLQGDGQPKSRLLAVPEEHRTNKAKANQGTAEKESVEGCRVTECRSPSTLMPPCLGRSWLNPRLLRDVCFMPSCQTEPSEPELGKLSASGVEASQSSPPKRGLCKTFSQRRCSLLPPRLRSSRCQGLPHIVTVSRSAEIDGRGRCSTGRTDPGV